MDIKQKKKKPSTSGRRKSGLLSVTTPGGEEPRPNWFPLGRDPWKDLFTPQVMQRLAEAHGISDPIKLNSLERKLCCLAELYIFELEYRIPRNQKAKAGVLYKDKIKWLNKNINTPALQLSKSLSGENLPWLSQFPNLTVRASYPAFYQIKRQLQQLLEWSTALEQSVNDLLSERDGNKMAAGRPITDLRYSLAYDLVTIYAASFGKRPSLVTRATVATGRSSTTDSDTLTFVRSAAKIILGDQSAQMLDETRTAISKHVGTYTQ